MLQLRFDLQRLKFAHLCAIFFASSLSCWSLAPIKLVKAQITPDGTLGTENSTVTPDTIKSIPSERIDGGAIRGANLFHSFTQFNIREGTAAYFTNPGGIENILTRVTGNNVSNILGTLGVLGNANLFLMNPNGIVFGQNARLDIGGSFFATTSNSLVFKNGWEFSATNPQAPPLLKINVPLGLQSSSNPVGDIANAGKLAVNPGESLTFWGSTVSSTGSLNAPGGLVQLLGERVGLFDNAQIDVSGNTGGGTVLIGGDLQGKGAVPNAARTYIGPDVTINADAFTRGNGGKVVVWADEATGFYGNISARGGLVVGNGGVVEVSGKENLIFRGKVDTYAINGLLGTLLLDPTNIIIANGSGDTAGDRTNTFAGNNSGIVGSILSAPVSNINDTAPTTIYESELEGLSGDTNIILQATNNITLQNLADNSLNLAVGKGAIAFTADADSDGLGNFVMEDKADTIKTNGRNIGISGASLILGNIDTSITADGAGRLLGTARVISTKSGVPLESISGNLSSPNDVDLFQIYLTGDGTFSASTVGGSQVDTQLFLFNANGFGVYANDNYSNCGSCSQSRLPDRHPLTPSQSGIYYLGVSSYNNDPYYSNRNSDLIFPDRPLDGINEPTRAGSAAPLVRWVNTDSRSGGNYTITLTGTEAATSKFIELTELDAGSIKLDATNGNISTGNLKASSNVGAGGAIALNATGDINLNSARLDVSAAIGGSITVNARNLELKEGSVLETGIREGLGTPEAQAGDITINATDNVLFDNSFALNNVDSDAEGKAGGVFITTGSLEVLNGAQLSTSTRGKGDAGSVTIEATDSVKFDGEGQDAGNSGAFSRVNSNAEGKAGGVFITTGSLEVLNGAQISASTNGKGDAGSVTIEATNSVKFDGEGQDAGNSGAFSRVNSGAEGKAGGVFITTGSLEVLNGAQISASTNGKGDAGSVTIEATDSVKFDGEDQDAGNSGAFSRVNSNAKGKAGGVFITTGSLEVLNGAQLSASTNGKGDAGSVTIEATDSVKFDGEDQDGFNSGAFSQVESNAEGKAGGVFIITSFLEVLNGAQLSASTNGKGDAGSVTIEATNSVKFDGEGQDADNSGAFSQVNSNAEGKAGGVFITAGFLEVLNGARISASTNGKGDAGDLFIKATELVEVLGTEEPGKNSRIGADVQSGGIGNAGNLTIETKKLVIRSSQVGSTTFGKGNAGNLTVNASESVEITGKISSTNPDPTKPLIKNPAGLFAQVNTQGEGNGGNLTVETPNLSVGDGGKIQVAVFGQGDAGNLFIRAADIDIYDTPGQADFFEGGIFAGFQVDKDESTALPKGDFGGTVTIETDRLRVRDGGAVTVFTEGDGNAGILRINAKDYIEVYGEVTAPTINSIFTSKISGEATKDSTGNGGTVILNTDKLIVRDSGKISASTSSIGKAGDILLNTNTLTVASGGEILAFTSGSGDGGTITVNAANSVSLNGEGGLSVAATADGTAGNLSVKTGQFNISNGAQVTVSSEQGQAGNLEITANSLFLDQGRISAETFKSGVEGGANITLKIADFLQMKNESQISATARENANGGNINIDTNFLIAFPSVGFQGSDIIAKATFGNGGRININTQGIFGIEEQSAIALNRTNDIDASSDFGASGEVQINTTIDPSQGLTQLPIVLNQPKLAPGCQASTGENQNKFIITGRGGLPLNPSELLTSQAVDVDWVSLAADAKKPTRSVHSQAQNYPKNEIVEAQGLVIDANGNINLVASAPTTTPHSSGFASVSCAAP